MRFRVKRQGYLNLNKALDKSKLIYVEVPVQTIHGQHRSHRWKKPYDALDQLKSDLGSKAKAENITFIDKNTNKKVNEEQLLEDYSKNARDEQTIQSYVAENYKVSTKKETTTTNTVDRKEEAISKFMSKYEKTYNENIDKLDKLLEFAKENQAEDTIQRITSRKAFLRREINNLRYEANAEANGEESNLNGAKKSFLQWNNGIDEFIEESKKDIADEIKLKEFARKREAEENKRKEALKEINNDEVSMQLYELYNNGRPERISLDGNYNLIDNRYERLNEDIKENLEKTRKSLSLAKDIFIDTSDKSLNSAIEEEKKVQAISQGDINKELKYYLDNDVEMSQEGNEYLQNIDNKANECERSIKSNDINGFDENSPIILEQANNLYSESSPMPLADFYFIKQYSINTKDINGDIKETKINAFIDRKSKQIVFKEDNNDLVSYDRKLSNEFNSYNNQLTNRYNKRQKEAKYYHNIEVGKENAVSKSGMTSEISDMRVAAQTKLYLSKALVELRKSNQYSKYPSTSDIDLKATKEELKELNGSFKAKATNKDLNISWQFKEKLNEEDFKDVDNGKEVEKLVGKLNELTETYGNTKKAILIRNNIVDKVLMGLKGSASKDIKVLENNKDLVQYADKNMENSLHELGQLYSYSYFNSMSQFPNATDDFLNGKDINSKDNGFKRNPNSISNKSKKILAKLKGNTLKGINNKSIPKEIREKIDNAVKDVKESLESKNNKKSKEINTNMDMFYEDLKAGRITLSQAINNPKYKECVYLLLVALQDEEDEIDLT